MNIKFFKNVGIIGLMLFCLCLNQIFCADLKREYLAPEQVVMSSEGIFVITEERLLPVESIM